MGRGIQEEKTRKRKQGKNKKTPLGSQKKSRKAGKLQRKQEKTRKRKQGENKKTPLGAQKKSRKARKLQRNHKNKKDKKKVKAGMYRFLERAGHRRGTKQNRQDEEEGCIEGSRYNKVKLFTQMLVKQVRNLKCVLKDKKHLLYYIYH